MNWLIGVLTGIGLFMWADWYSPHTQEAIKARELINECQKSLPRDQICELVAVPAESKNTKTETK